MAEELTPHPNPLALSALIAKGRMDHPDKRARDLAAELGISEGVMLSGRCGDHVTRLVPATKSMVLAFEQLGEVMVLTRNDSVVHEKVGTFGSISGSDKVAIVLNHDIDLRIFLGHWLHVFAVEEQTGKGVRRSIQIFDKYGDAVHKIHLRDASNVAAFETLVTYFRHNDQRPFFEAEDKDTGPSATERPDAEIDVAGLRRDWSQMTEVHQFFGMLKSHDVTRLQAHRLIGDDYAWQLDTGAARAAMTAAAEMKLPIMVFVSNPGCVQIHSGPIENLKTMGPWFNVLDPGFHMHLREDHVSAVWLVRKPNAYGHVTSIEVYDKSDRMMVQFYGVRDETADENPDWRALAENLPRITSAREVA